MSAGITVEDFKYVRGVNDAEYIELLKNAYERQKYITSKAIAKLKKQPKRKIGEWVQVPRFEGDTQPDLECPFCKHKVGWWDATKYCSECGADMRGREDE